MRHHHMPLSPLAMATFAIAVLFLVAVQVEARDTIGPLQPNVPYADLDLQGIPNLQTLHDIDIDNFIPYPTGTVPAPEDDIQTNNGKEEGDDAHPLTSSSPHAETDMLPHLSASLRQIHTHLRTVSLPAISRQAFDLSSYTPFCSDGTSRTTARVPTPTPDILTKAPDCIRWEEQELDMLLMYIDLLAVGMKRTLAEQFYKQLRCLSRANIKKVSNRFAWQVCFAYDFSQHVGTLLAHYINQDFELLPPVTPAPTPAPAAASVSRLMMTSNESMSTTGRNLASPSSKFLFGSSTVTSQNRGSFLMLAFHASSSFRIYRNTNTSTAKFEERTQTSCCTSCADPSYFVNIEQDQCLRDPFGRHCCHKACKSLGRLRIGVATSISYCCQRTSPHHCKR